MEKRKNSGKAYLGIELFKQKVISATELETIIRDQIEISELIINPTHSCNLRCQHCSYAMKTAKKELVSEDDLKDFMTQAKGCGVEQVVFLGMEPLLDYGRTGSLVAHANSLDLQVGMVTNGLLVNRCIDKMKKHQFFYIDVSLDGHREDHEKNRGKGTYNDSVAGIKSLISQEVSAHVNVSATLMSFNGDSLCEMIAELKGKGVSYFNIGTYIQTDSNPQSFQISLRHIKEFIERTSDLVDDKTGINLDIHPHIYGFWDQLFDEGIIDPEQVLLDNIGRIYVQVNNCHHNLTIRNAGMSRVVETMIITPEGHILDDYEIVARKDYLKHSLGSICDTSFLEFVERMKEITPKRLVHKVQTIQQRGADYSFLQKQPGQNIECV